MKMIARLVRKIKIRFQLAVVVITVAVVVS